MNRALRRISLVVLAMFLLLLLSVNYVQAFEPSSLAVQRGNARVFSQQYQYQRGSILTSNNKTIAESLHVKGIYAYQRSYPDPFVYAPVTGYDSLYSATGIEKTEDRFLSGSDPQLTVHNLIDLVTGKPRRGATVQLTINSAAQTTAYERSRRPGCPAARSRSTRRPARSSPWRPTRRSTRTSTRRSTAPSSSGPTTATSTTPGSRCSTGPSTRPSRPAPRSRS